MAETPIVFCAVTAQMQLMPYAPRAAKVFRSAWMPAPPEESDPAIVSTFFIVSFQRFRSFFNSGEK